MSTLPTNPSEAFRKRNPHLYLSIDITDDSCAGNGARTHRSPKTVAMEGKESDLHDKIAEFCKQNGWICLHGSMAHRAMRTLGEPDFTILADSGRVFFIEAKSKTGKLRPEQLGMRLMAEKLGHTIHVVRSMDEFERVVGTIVW